MPELVGLTKGWVTTCSWLLLTIFQVMGNKCPFHNKINFLDVNINNSHEHGVTQPFVTAWPPNTPGAREADGDPHTLEQYSRIGRKNAQ